MKYDSPEKNGLLEGGIKHPKKEKDIEDFYIILFPD